MSEASIVITARDSYSSAIRTMAQETKRFSKDQEEMDRILQKFTNTQHKLRSEYDASKKKLKELEAQFAATGDEAVKLEADSERLKMDNLQRNLSLVTKGAAAARREMEKTGDAFSRSSEKGTRSIGQLASVTGQLGIALASQMALPAIQQIAGGWATSALGSDAGNTISSILSGGVSGAAIGTMILPGIGTAIGALGGAVIGAVQGVAQAEQNKDEYFKSYYNGIIDEQVQQRTSDLEAGSSIAAGREKDKVSFTTLFGGDRGIAESYLSNLVGMANTTPFLYDDLTAMSKTLATYGYGADSILPVLTKIGDAGAALGMNTSDMSMVATALGRMKSSDKATLEYLNILNDRGIGAVGMLAEAKGMSVGDAYTAISKGQIKGGDAAEIILAALEQKYKGSMKEQSQTFSGMTSTLEGMKQEMQNAYGEGYNEERKLGIQKEIDAMNGPTGDEQRALNQRKGELAAYRENLQEQYKREAKGFMMGTHTLNGRNWGAENIETLQKMGKEYRSLKSKADAGDKEAVLKMANLEEQAEALAKAAYDSSDWASKELTAQQENTREIRNLTGQLQQGIMLKYAVEQEGTKGRAAVRPWGTEEKVATAPTAASGNNYLQGRVAAPTGSSYAAGLQAGLGADGSHAAGLRRVPYNGYVAELHQDERVLTASEARQADAGGGGLPPIYITGNTLVVRQESDIDAIALALAEKVALMNQRGTY